MRMTAAALLALALAPAARAAVPEGFPIGIYGAEVARHYAELKASGIDTIVVGSDPERLGVMAAEAKRLGLRLMPYPNSLRAGPAGRARSWPIAAWYIQDEPEVNAVAPEALEEMSRLTRAWDPRPQAFCVGRADKLKPYAHVADAVMLDYYPVPYKPADSLADQLDLARAALPPGKPLWMVVQAYAWNDEAGFRKRGITSGRFPDHAEIRFMSYLSVLHGAKGLFFFQFPKPDGRTLLDFPEQWQAVRGVARELSAMKRVFEKGARLPLPFPPDPYGPEARAWRHRGRDYVVILNRKAGVLQRVPEELLTPDWRPLFEARRDPRDLLERLEGAWYLRPYQVLVLEGALRWLPRRRATVPVVE